MNNKDPNYCSKRVTVILKPSHRCNFNCSYCYDRFERSKDSAILPVDDCIKCIQRLYDWFGSLEVVWHGGEPLLLGIEYIEKVLSTFKGYDINGAGQSNGSLLNDDFMKLVKEYEIDAGVSGDGLYQNKFRTPIDIQKINTLYKKYNVSMGTLKTITPESSASLIQDYTYAEALGFRFGGNVIFGEKLTREEYAVMLQNILSFFRFLCTNANHLARPFTDLVRHYAYQNTILCERVGCVGRGFSISPDGGLSQCGHAGPRKYYFGNLLDDNFKKEDIYTSNGFKLLSERKAFAVEHCRHCDYFNSCRGNCFSSSVIDTEDGYVFDELLCEFNKKLVDGCYSIIEETYKNNTMRNKEIIDMFRISTNGELKKGKDYKYPSIMI